MNKDDICKDFCSQIALREVPAGWAVQTPFKLNDGDRIGFYIINCGNNKFRLEDSGQIVPLIDANGTNLESGARAKEFRLLLNEYSVEYDSETMEIVSEILEEGQVPEACVQFVSLLIRIQDLHLLRPEIIENTFKDDAKASIAKILGNLAEISFDEPPTPELSDYYPDVVVRSKKTGESTAVYLGTNEARVSEAISAWLEGQLKRSRVKVSMLYETEKPHVPQKLLRRAQNRLDSVSIYREDEVASIKKIGRQVGIYTT